MWIYEKKLEFPVKIKNPDPRMAKHIIAQYGGPNGELSASLQYLNQRYQIPTGRAKGILTDIGTEELAHMEMIATMVYQLTDGISPEQWVDAGLGGLFVEHGGIFWVNPDGVPWTAAYLKSPGDPVATFVSNMAAEERARSTYEHLIRLTDDPDVKEPLRFLREREVVHFQRFGETLDYLQDQLKKKKC